MKNQLGHAMAAMATVLAMAAPAAHADPIEIVFSGIADFELDDQTFENAAFTVRTTADTANLSTTMHPSEGYDVIQYEGLKGMLSVAGLGHGSFTNDIAIFNNPIVSIAGLMTKVDFIPFSSVFQIADLMGLYRADLATYDLKSDLTLDDAQFYDPMQWFQIDTSFGKLTATGFQSVTMQVSTTTVPEPSGAMLFALGGALIGAGVARARATRA